MQCELSADLEVGDLRIAVLGECVVGQLHVPLARQLVHHVRVHLYHSIYHILKTDQKA